MNHQKQEIEHAEQAFRPELDGGLKTAMQSELIEVWLATLRQTLPELRACAVVLDTASEGFYWSQNIDETSSAPNESLFAAAGLARRSNTPISTHDRHFLTVAVQIPDPRFSSEKSTAKQNHGTALGSIAVSIDGSGELGEAVVAEVSRSAAWYGNLHQKFFGRRILGDEELPWLDAMLCGGSLTSGVLATVNRFVEFGVAERVAIGLVKRDAVRQIVISGQREFAKRSPLQHRLRKTMNETLGAWRERLSE